MATATIEMEELLSRPQVNTAGFTRPVGNINFEISKRHSPTSLSIVFCDYESRGSTRSGSVHIKKQSDEYLHLLEEAPWAEEFYSAAFELNSVDTLLPFYREIHSLLLTGQFDLCDSLIRHTSVNHISDTLLVGLPRLTNMWKENLSSWELLLQNVKDELDRRNKNSEELLSGLS